MKRRTLCTDLLLLVIFAFQALFCLPGIFASEVASKVKLPSGSSPEAIEFSHFPDRMHAFIWRNWTVVPVQRLAKVLGAKVEQVEKVASSMGLPPQEEILPEWKSRGYITILRRNWHLLPYEQLLQLLDMSAEQLHHSLLEDDFLFIKLGSIKPKCEPLRYIEPNEKTQKQAAWIKQVVQDELAEIWSTPEEPRFSFVQELNTPKATPATQDTTSQKAVTDLPLRYIYSYCGMFGDPLSGEGPLPYPNGQLQQLSQAGVTGIWLHVVLRDLAPGTETFPEFGKGHEKRLATLRDLVNRAAKYNIGVYLYMNEPRGMPPEFFAKDPARKAMQGVPLRQRCAMCTSNTAVRKWIEDSLAHVFKNVPELAGVFTITASENLTSCASKGKPTACPRCKDRSRGEIIAEVNTTIERGVHRGNPNARVIVWDWGWTGDIAKDAIPRLPKNVYLQSVSEWSKPFTRGGVKTAVGEYSISVVGPGPRATRHWKLAKDAGLKTAAKVQINNTWELSAVPYLPVYDLVAQHMANLRDQDVDGLMLSWSLGGYPSPNLEIAQAIYDTKDAPKDELIETVLQNMAEKRYGKSGAAEARAAWSAFSKAFSEFPYHITTLYCGPQNSGPANLLYAKPTGYRATMVGFPYDDLNHWLGCYPAETLGSQFRKTADAWQEGIKHLEKAVAVAPENQKETVTEELAFARAAGLHFAASANQVKYVLARNALANDQNLPPERRAELEKQLRTAITAELATAKAAFACTKADSHIGYEASNHYFYIPQDLAEKVINCRYLLEKE